MQRNRKMETGFGLKLKPKLNKQNEGDRWRKIDPRIRRWLKRTPAESSRIRLCKSRQSAVAFLFFFFYFFISKLEKLQWIFFFVIAAAGNQ